MGESKRSQLFPIIEVDGKTDSNCLGRRASRRFQEQDLKPEVCLEVGATNQIQFAAESASKARIKAFIGLPITISLPVRTQTWRRFSAG